MSDARARGSILLYGVAFALMLVGGAVFVVASVGSLQSIRLLWVSAAFSAAALAVAAASLVAPRR